MSRSKRPSHKKPSRPVWPLIGMVAGLILLGGALGALFAQNAKAAIEVTGRPSLRVDQETIDLGRQRLGSTVQVAFGLTNVGDQPLRFTEVPYVEVVEGC